METLNYIEIPIVEGGRTREGVDCWGLACVIYDEGRGIKLPHYEEFDWKKGSEVCTATAQLEAEQHWYEVAAEERKEYDLVVLRVKGMPWHIGILADQNRFVHADPMRGICIERLDSLHWKNRVVAYYSYRV